MGEKNMRLALMACLVMGLIVGEAQASFKSCYKNCFRSCIARPSGTAYSCSITCLEDCIGRPSPKKTSSPLSHSSNSNNNSLYFCKLGCASSMCAKLSSKHDPRSQKVENCLDSCSDTCAKNKMIT